MVPSSRPDAHRERAGEADAVGAQMRLDPLRAAGRGESQLAVEPAAGQRQRAGEAAGVGAQIAAARWCRRHSSAAMAMVARPPFGSRIRPLLVNGPSLEPPLARVVEAGGVRHQQQPHVA